MTIALTLIAVPLMVSGQSVGRVSVKVVDSLGNPIPEVEVTITSPDLQDYEERAKTNKKGKVLVAHNDATLSYNYKFEKAGFQPVVERMRATYRGVTQKTVVMLPAGSASPDQPAPPEGQAALAFNAGVEAQNAGELETAVERYRRAAELDPALAAPHTGLAGVFFMQERWQEAAAAAEEALVRDSGDQRAMQLRYEAYRLAGDVEKAAQAAADLKRAGIGEEVVGRAYNEAVDAYQAGDRETAKRLLEEAVAMTPDLARPRLFLAAICREEGDFDRAKAEVAAVLQRVPSSSLALRLGFEIAVARGDWVTEKAMAEKLVTADPGYAGEQFIARSGELYDGNHFSEASAMAMLALQARPEAAKAHFILGMASFNTGQSETARKHLARFVELAPEDPDAAIARDLLSYSN